MKTIWNKIPAWGKAIIFLLVLGMPVRMIIQATAQYNMYDGSGWGWALLVAIPLLVIFSLLASRWSPFNRTGDVKINFSINFRDSKVWMRLVGLVLFCTSAGVLFTELFDVRQEHHIEFFESFRSIGHFTAIPLLMVFAFTAGVVEEIVFRGYVQNSLVRAYPKTISFLAIGLVFALVHFLPLPLVFAFVLVSLTFSIVADEFKSLGVVILAHILIDVYGLLEMYFDFSMEMGALNMVITAVVFVVSLFLLLTGNTSIFPKQIRKMELVEVGSNG